MKKAILTFTALLALAAGATAQEAFRPKLGSNPDGPWSFGTSLKGGDFTALPKHVHADGMMDAWVMDDHNPEDTTPLGVFHYIGTEPMATAGGWVMQPNTLVMTPGANRVGSSVRFTAPSDGWYEVQATWTKLEPNANNSWAWVNTNAASVTGAVYEFTPEGFKEVFSHSVEGAGRAATYMMLMKLQRGEYVDFSVSDGDDGGNGDAVSADIIIGKN